MLNAKDKIGIVCCSNGQKLEKKSEINKLNEALNALEITTVFSPYIYEQESVFGATANERAKALMDLFINKDIKIIFDISGGDIANGILPFLDYEAIKDSKAIFAGYSDLTTVINAIYTKTGKSSILYQLRNITYDNSEIQIKNIMSLDDSIFKFEYSFCQGNEMSGILVGGNIRCFLKLAGTEYMPDLNGKILLLESYGGKVAQIETFFCQLQQLGAFDSVAGIILGTFTQMEEEKFKPTVIELLNRFIPKDLPVATTNMIGHGTDSRAAIIGKKIVLSK